MRRPATIAAVAAFSAFTALPALAEDRVVVSVAALDDARKAGDSVALDRCRVGVSFANDGPRAVHLSVELLRLLSKEGFAAMTALPVRSFGSKAMVRGTVAPGEKETFATTLLGLDCPDIVGFVMLPACAAGEREATGEDCATALVASPDTLVPIGMPHDPDLAVEDAEAGIELIEPGPVQGVWRVVRRDTDETPVMRMSLVQDTGGPPEGDYMLLTGICGFGGGGNCALSGGTGTIASGYHDAKGGRTTLTFNPTPDPRAGFILQWSSGGEGTLRPVSGTAPMSVQVIAVE